VRARLPGPNMARGAPDRKVFETIMFGGGFGGGARTNASEPIGTRFAGSSPDIQRRLVAAWFEPDPVQAGPAASRGRNAGLVASRGFGWQPPPSAVAEARRQAPVSSFWCIRQFVLRAGQGRSWKGVQDHAPDTVNNTLADLCRPGELPADRKRRSRQVLTARSWQVAIDATVAEVTLKR